jgi:hypothetical protein
MTRDEKGRFVKGHADQGAGRKPKAIEEQYLEAFRASVSPDDWQAIIKRAVNDAKQGDAQARKFIADYMIGQPVQRQEIKVDASMQKAYTAVSPDDWDD